MALNRAQTVPKILDKIRNMMKFLVNIRKTNLS